jgi:hypothetical protein
VLPSRHHYKINFIYTDPESPALQKTCKKLQKILNPGFSLTSRTCYLTGLQEWFPTSFNKNPRGKKEKIEGEKKAGEPEISSIQFPEGIYFFRGDVKRNFTTC